MICWPASRAGPPAVFEQALGKVRDIGDWVGEAYVLCGLGAAKTRLGELGEGTAQAERAGPGQC